MEKKSVTLYSNGIRTQIIVIKLI